MPDSGIGELQHIFSNREDITSNISSTGPFEDMPSSWVWLHIIAWSFHWEKYYWNYYSCFWDGIVLIFLHQWNQKENPNWGIIHKLPGNLPFSHFYIYSYSFHFVGKATCFLYYFHKIKTTFLFIFFFWKSMYIFLISSLTIHFALFFVWFLFKFIPFPPPTYWLSLFKFFHFSLCTKEYFRKYIGVPNRY